MRFFRRFFKFFARKGQKLYLLKADSHRKDTLERVKKILDGKFLDFLFIDADHNYEGVKMDFKMYFRLVRSGDIIDFHDIITAKGVEKFWNEIRKKFNYEENW